MNDTTKETSPFRHTPPMFWFLAVIALAIGTALRCFVIQGELWLDEMWSLIHVAEVRTPIEILTGIKHDNNHLLNSVWIWALGSESAPWAYRAPSLVLSVASLILVFREIRHQRDQKTFLFWFLLLATSYPLILYTTEARGYSLTILMTLVSYFSLKRLSAAPHDLRALLTFSLASSVGCLSHATYVLFLAPAIAWLGFCLASSSRNTDARRIVRVGILPPALTATTLLLIFYHGIEIGGAPLLPYLEVAASTISVSFGGEALSATNPAVSGWSLFLAVVAILLASIELFLWLRTQDPFAVLVGLILVTPWLAVWTLQPHFILPRYFLIQIVFGYLLIARFFARLTRQGAFGASVATCMAFAIIVANTRHTIQLWTFGRSHFEEIFAAISAPHLPTPNSVGGDQDFQNSLRLRYLKLRKHNSSLDPTSLAYIPQYRKSPTAPRFVIRETLDAFESFPTSFTDPLGRRYDLIRQYKAPPLSASNVSVYEIHH